ncbi:MAG: hypothetical protein ACXV7I_15360 [Ilumatobacteraceae bacterium]
MADHHYSNEELAEMDRMLDEMQKQSRDFGGELLHARRIIRLLTASQLVLPRPLQEALDDYHSYMLHPPLEQAPPSN